MSLQQTEPKKIYIGSGLTPRLPSAYQEVEYIQNSGTQYINTGLQVKKGYHFVARLNSISNDNDSGGRITGGYLGPDSVPGGHVRLYFGGVRNGGWNYGYLSQFSNGGTGSGSTGTDYEVEFSWISGNAFIKINGSSIYTSSDTYTTNLSGDCPLFAQLAGGPYEPHPGLRVYSAKYYDSNDDLVRDFVPCYRIADGVIGMYDLVNDVFYTNAGSGTFSKGADVNLPYKEVKKVMMRPNNIETQVWPLVSPIEEYVMLSEGGDINKFNELTVDGSYQSVFDNTTNWRTGVIQSDRFNQSYKLFSNKEIVGFDVIVQYAAPNNWSSVQWGIVDSANTVGIGLTDGRDSYGSSAWYGVRLDATGLSSSYVSGSMTTADIHVVGEKTGDTWTVTGSGGVTFTKTRQANYVCQRMNCGAWMRYTGTTGYIKKVVLYLKPLSS